MDLVQGKDVFLVIATGQGKTAVLHAPLQAAQARGEKGIGLLIGATKVLAEQQAAVASDHGLRAIASNEDTVRVSRLENRDLFVELANGEDVRLGVMSPQMLRSKKMLKLLKEPLINSLVRWFLVDEAHLVNEDGSVFQAPYQTLSTMRVILSSKTVFAAVTGTASPSEALAMAKALGFQPGNYVNARYSTDRPNIKYIPRFFQHASSGRQFLDLSFLIPFGMKSINEIESTLIFATTVNTGCNIQQFTRPIMSHPHIPPWPRHTPQRIYGRALILVNFHILNAYDAVGAVNLQIDQVIMNSEGVGLWEIMGTALSY